MHLISKKPFNDAAKKHPNQRQALEDVYSILKKGEYQTPDDLMAVFPSLENFKNEDKLWAMDIAGNHLRMIVFIQFLQKRMCIKRIFTHAEYDKV